MEEHVVVPHIRNRQTIEFYFTQFPKELQTKENLEKVVRVFEMTTERKHFNLF